MGVAVSLYSGVMSQEQIQAINPSLIISYNYQYIIHTEIIDAVNGNILNLHISYLPWNKGSSPNFWSFIENTPKGVTIHKVDAHLDTGLILYQKEIFFDENIETFKSSYNKLNNAIVELLCKHWDEIISKKYTVKEQKGEGTYHTMKDFKQFIASHPINWNEIIANYKHQIHTSRI